MAILEVTQFGSDFPYSITENGLTVRIDEVNGNLILECVE